MAKSEEEPNNVYQDVLLKIKQNFIHLYQVFFFFKFKALNYVKIVKKKTKKMEQNEKLNETTN